jgi:hypothetical protein
MMRVLILFTVLMAATLTAMLAALPAHAANFCQHDDATPQPLPAALVPKVEKIFGIHTTDSGWVARSTVARCMGGRLWACNMGANLPCGKANTAHSLPAGDDWCKQNPNSDFIPAYITGHDSVEQWRCSNGAPSITGRPQPTDAQGYLSNYWKILQ